MQQSRFRACPEKAERAPTRICEIPGGKSSFPAGNGKNPTGISLFHAEISEFPREILLFPIRISEIPARKSFFRGGNREILSRKAASGKLRKKLHYLDGFERYI